MTRLQTYILAFVFVLAGLARSLSLPDLPFFCDVPANVQAVVGGSMQIQFPLYVPYHLALKAFGFLSGNVFVGAVWFSLLCGMGAWVYCVRFAYERAGFSAALITAVMMGFSPIALYFSCVGASYTTELLAMSAIIYHGNRSLKGKTAGDYKWVVFWFLFGFLMRPLSFLFAGLGVAYLLWKDPTRQKVVFTLLALTVGLMALVGLTTFYVGSWPHLYDSTGPIRHDSKNFVSIYALGLNLVRNGLFFLWSLNFFVLFIPLALWLNRKKLDRELMVFFALLGVPYALLLLEYLPHAGYLCLIFPLAICLPWISRECVWPGARGILLAVIMGLTGAVQFFGCRPVSVTGLPSMVLDTWVLTYTQQGIKARMFSNLTQAAQKSHLGENYIPSKQ